MGERDSIFRGTLARPRLLLALAAVAGILAFAVGCGGDDSDATSSPPDTTASEPVGNNATNGDSQSGGPQSGPGQKPATTPEDKFVAKANAVCEKRSAEVQKQGKKVFQEYFSKSSEAGARAMANRVIIPVFEKELRDLQGLNPPPESARGLEELQAAIRRMIDQLKEDPTAKEFYPYTEAEKIGDKHGLTACGQP